MTTYYIHEYKICESLIVSAYLYLEKDLSCGYWNGEIIFTDYTIERFENAEGKELNSTPTLTSQFISVIERECYSANRKTSLYDDMLAWFYEDNEIMIKREAA